MRVCHLVRQFHPSVGGLERFVTDLACEQTRLGHACDVLTLNRVFRTGERLPSEDEVAGLRVRRVSFLGGQRLFLPLIPQRALRNYDVLHVHGVDGMFERVARQLRANQIFVATSHGLFFHTPWMAGPKALYFHSVTRLCASRYDLILANSASDEQRLRAISDRVVLVPNGVRPLAAMGAGCDIVYLGRLASHKHVERLMATLARPPLAAARLHIVGPDWDVTAEQLRSVARGLGVDDRVLFHGLMDVPALEALVRRCAVFASASTYEGFGMSLIEAMSAGLIPVVQANPSFAELVGASGLGSTVDFADAVAAAEKIRSAIDGATPEQRAAAAAFAARFSWRAHAERTLAAYREAARARKLARRASERVPIGPS